MIHYANARCLMFRAMPVWPLYLLIAVVFSCGWAGSTAVAHDYDVASASTTSGTNLSVSTPKAHRANVGSTRSSTSSAALGPAAKGADEGIYVIKGAQETYVGQSGNIGSRLASTSRAGGSRRREVDAAEATAVSGGKTAREIAEQNKIDNLGGITRLGNLRNPIGPKRFRLMPEGYTR